ncbi:MAG: glycosyltransferase family 2 protein [Rikenellaceae bacterium]|jgi:GT2 family glycosyltransferase|nr:glycosyltransferase family 2 protein [Rikenellaceae bacterium]
MTSTRQSANSVAKVVILNYNGEQTLRRFLPSVVANTPPEVGVVVADNGSADGSVELVEREFPTVEVIKLDRNYGFAGGYNRALREVAADYFILLNSDVETPAGWCEPLIEYLDNHPDTAAVAPKLLSYDHPVEFEYAGASGGFIDALGYPFCRGRILGTVERDAGQYDDAREVFWATGACFACRAEVFWAKGGFDDDFFAHQEEIDLCWRMQLTGWRIAVEPRSRVYHLGAGTLPPSPAKVYLNHRNNLAMLYKNLPARRLWAVIGVRMILDGVLAVGYLLRGKRADFNAVWSAHRDFCKMRREKLRARRRAIQLLATARPTGIYRGSIVLRYLLGRHTFDHLL